MKLFQRLSKVLVLMMIVSSAHTQPFDTSKFKPSHGTSPTVCIPTGDALKVLLKGMQAKELENKVKNLEFEIILWQGRLRDKDSVINSYKITDSTQKHTIQADSLIQVNLQTQVTKAEGALLKSQQETQDAIKKGNRKSTWNFIKGTIVGGGAGVLIGSLRR